VLVKKNDYKGRSIEGVSGKTVTDREKTIPMEFQVEK
jgi:hypothetical protein